MNSPKLVTAICEAGAFGMLAMGFSNSKEARRLVDDVKKLTNKPLGANLMIMNHANQDILEILADAGVKIVGKWNQEDGKKIIQRKKGMSCQQN